MNTNEHITVLLRAYIYTRIYTGACYILPKRKPVRASKGSKKKDAPDFKKGCTRFAKRMHPIYE
jgi:hypothetical protein